jgi:thioesterase domain-containing protein
MMTSAEHVICSPICGTAAARTHRQAAEAPRVFFLPGIGGKEGEFWEPFRKIVQVIPVAYLDWTELASPGATFKAEFFNAKKQIEEICPCGPLRIAGYSIGAPLAYACAAAFQSEGREVEVLALIDGRTGIGPADQSLRARLHERWRKFRTFELRAGLASLIAKCLTNKIALPSLHMLAPIRHIKLPWNFDVALHHKLNMQTKVRLFGSWWREIIPPDSPYTAPTLLFRSEQHGPQEADDLGWAAYCENLTIIQMRGSHRNILDPENLSTVCVALCRTTVHQ